MREVLDLIFEFLLSCLVIGGGGVLMLIGKGDSSFITSMIALVIYFWFQSRSTTAAVNNLLKQFPTTQAIVPPVPTPVLSPAPVETNPTNPPVVPPGNNI